MNKFTKTIFIIILVCFGVVLFSKPIFKRFKNTDTIINKIGCRIFDFNSISVKTKNDLDIDIDIDIDKIELKHGDKTVYNNNEQRDKIGQFYGHVILGIYYDGLLVSEIGHWKRNNWYVNDYEITLKKQGIQYLVDYEITGPDGKNDNFQKRYIYTSENRLIRIDYQNESGEVYNTEKRW